ncbi:MAG: type II toxin-antitoxin system RelB/DinJ family antitoxin [Alteromonadaceae bacterium]|nr:type II toxin-antitoxin system RelB/DinJ family antitoxin [Alteromonadaceae bacterium]
MVTVTKTEMVRARVSSQLKNDSEQVLQKLGMNVSDAIRIFLTQVSLRNEFPIELKVPNKITLNAFAEEITDDVYETADDLFAEVIESDTKN